MNATLPAARITPVANAGILAEGPGPDGVPRKVLVDALCHRHDPFRGTQQETARAILEGTPPFHRLDALCFSHEHRDHFHADLAAEFCRLRPEVPIIANPRASEAVRKRLPYPKNLLEIAPALHTGQTLEVNGLALHAVALLHAGEAFRAVLNLAFVLGFAHPVAHTGDAEASPNNCRALAAFLPGQGILCAHFPWLTLPRSFASVRKYLDPETLFLLHLPNQEQDRWNWGKAVARAMACHTGSPRIVVGTDTPSGG